MNGEKELHFAPFRYQESILNSRSERFDLKVEALENIWRKLQKLDTNTDRNLAAEILNWAKLHTLNILLSAEWNGFKGMYENSLRQQIEQTEKSISLYGKGFQVAVAGLIGVLNNPWNNPTLQTILNWTSKHSICSKQIEFFYTETPYLVSIRLKKLCESQCEDLALNLAKVFMDCCVIAKSNFNGTENQIRYIDDILIALLHKFHQNDELIAKMKSFSFEEGLQFAKRFANKQIRYLRLWENSRVIAVLALQTYISQIMIKYDSNLRPMLSNFVKLYKSMCSTKSCLERFSESMECISNLTDSNGLQDLCSIFREEYEPAIKPLILKMYVKMLTAEMNINEVQRDSEEITSINSTKANLARMLTSLAEFFDDHVNVARECLLTAFSIFPTKERLKGIENLARRSGFEGVEMERPLKCSHLPAQPILDKVGSQCICGDWVIKPELELPRTNIPLYEAMQNSVLGISETLCDDLVICLSSPRNKIFNWLLPWKDLHKLCVLHLENPQATNNFTKKLNYLNVDYSAFQDIKREPINYFEGIENGYEHYIYPDLGIKFPKNPSLCKKGKSSDKTDLEKKIIEGILAGSAMVNIERLSL
ncbi:unnamed protein product [Callosobruchus maculatus]|uniref:Uncharacterized protein n=1 Tax=Callosobruchus maculatus TaxID=64391 RepID=A0A653BUQ7_CALMS|nr:unnamed protein product [Callosobruchus maculatus]